MGVDFYHRPGVRMLLQSGSISEWAVFGANDQVSQTLALSLI
jgi:hypothetical protein